MARRRRRSNRSKPRSKPQQKPVQKDELAQASTADAVLDEMVEDSAPLTPRQEIQAKLDAKSAEQDEAYQSRREEVDPELMPRRLRRMME